MKIMWISRLKEVDAPSLTIDSIPSLRLVARHSPRQRIEVMIGVRPYLVEIGELDLDHHDLVKRNAHMVQKNMDRDQLQRLSNVHEVCPPRHLHLVLYPSEGYDANGTPVK